MKSFFNKVSRKKLRKMIQKNIYCNSIIFSQSFNSYLNNIEKRFKIFFVFVVYIHFKFFHAHDLIFLLLIIKTEVCLGIVKISKHLKITTFSTTKTNQNCFCAFQTQSFFEVSKLESFFFDFIDGSNPSFHEF